MSISKELEEFIEHDETRNTKKRTNPPEVVTLTRTFKPSNTTPKDKEFSFSGGNQIEKFNSKYNFGTRRSSSRRR